jgi:hypothetical protein
VIEIETEFDYKIYADLWKDIANHICTIPNIINFHPWGSDHLSYLQKKIPSILTINKDGMSYNIRIL